MGVALLYHCCVHPWPMRATAGTPAPALLDSPDFELSRCPDWITTPCIPIQSLAHVDLCLNFWLHTVLVTMRCPQFCLSVYWEAGCNTYLKRMRTVNDCVRLASLHRIETRSFSGPSRVKGREQESMAVVVAVAVAVAVAVVIALAIAATVAVEYCSLVRSHPAQWFI
ncbi:hypothetical protein BC939DRAFT_474685 [Gamsiella multidivaricata]|uniref:uncharacterized protein n=1 Tax=Gamsiella multidivaricata TaxID=101098 RepID=UPI00221EEA3B|nr:uncharacterized protein BC939DRAFT_474685 [Gamsiella multidivaricata]KAI7828845.1 hypothetical protein BC939DRAFT_474685 [Gamsiella multidivaricata]